jgi:glycosyltransferase involved in cell wall biosynthesis
MAESLGVQGKFVVAYLGTHGMAHALKNVLLAAEQLRDQPEIAFLLVGHGAEKNSLERTAVEMNLPNVFFRDTVPKERMPDVWSICDVALVHLKDEPVFSTVIPSKIFEAFGMGVPVMIVQPKGEAAGLVEDAGAGEWVAPENPDELAKAVRRWHETPSMVNDYARCSQQAAAENSRDRLASEMLQILRSL